MANFEPKPPKTYRTRAESVAAWTYHGDDHPCKSPTPAAEKKPKLERKQDDDPVQEAETIAELELRQEYVRALSVFVNAKEALTNASSKYFASVHRQNIAILTNATNAAGGSGKILPQK
jgi:hypothetical protein